MTRSYEITYLLKGKVLTTIIEADFYQDAREILKKQHKNKMEVLGWVRADKN